MQGLDQLFYLHGIGYDYTKYNGEHVYFDHQTRLSALRCCGVNTENGAQVDELNFNLDVMPWLNVVEEVTLADANSGKFSLKVPESFLSDSIVIRIPELSLSVTVGLSQAPVCGDYRYEGQTYLEVKVELGQLPAGYFEMQIEGPFGTKTTQLWSVPPHCYAIENDHEKRVGLSVQLYTLCSARNSGIGDFRDLYQLISSAAVNQCDFILLNPLHLLFEAQPERASPYSPSHRCLINPLYIALDWSVELLSKDYHLVVETSDEPAQSSHHEDYIDYCAVAEVKYRQLTHLFEQCQGVQAVSSAVEAFKLSRTQALDLSFLSEREWFFQWLAYEQLSACQLHAKASGMVIGLINDLAVGCAKEGHEFAQNDVLFAQGANVGAPPDPWAESGQNWGLPALNPVTLKQDRYAYFRSLVRSNMMSVGALRIDHVMAIRRLWWCFEADGQQSGCYVYYPFEHLLAILKIESHLNQTMVIGEDLGIVPPEISTAMEESNLYGNILMYFAKDQRGDFKPTHQYRSDTLLMVANHDVAPFFAWWNGMDVDLRKEYQLCNEQEAAQMALTRNEDKERLLSWLELSAEQVEQIKSDAMRVYCAVLKKLAASPSKLLAIQLDDLEQQLLPVNIPGTDREYPNWRRRLAVQADQTIKQNSNLMTEIKRIREQA
ncbi:4-alpha-glucanotransferase [Pseudoalteromonas rubra]|uniref:4-alpha-glucanotransferase n=1 Tax=Pseudoalteromonas rubra TaxID=43658 RepID=A0A5S3WUS6_9GAMM|nr:4-alpha-glucanotransferase [Pseudoalteromonas rubra]TMP31742.1 4-alpha-glucanotransferase [Pseudoalteromonas rubra]TMP33176.1 4-alpha-glucanotransferase [Pseudoalteromonas rubra]